MAGNHLKPKELQRLQRDNNKLLMAVLFMVLFSGWIAALIYMALNISPSTFEAFGMGTITGALIVILKDIFQFFFRKSGTEVER